MAVGAVKILTGTSVTRDSMHSFMAAMPLAHGAPAAVLAAVLLVATRRTSNILVLPALLLGSAILFYLALAVAGVPPARAQTHGWMLGPFMSGHYYQPLPLTDLQRVDWSAVVAQAGGVATIMIVATIGLLLSVTRLEVVA